MTDLQLEWESNYFRKTYIVDKDSCEVIILKNYNQVVKDDEILIVDNTLTKIMSIKENTKPKSPEYWE